MKPFLIACLYSLTSLGIKAQDPVKWAFSSQKIDAQTYELHLTATMQEPWKIYSQSTPDGGPLATSFTFTRNPFLSFEGKVKELGEMHKKHEEVFDVDVYYYQGKVDFVQVVKVKGKAKTNVAGKLEFMACDEHQCLPPKVVSFNISL